VKEFLYCYDELDLHDVEQAIIRQAMEKLPARVIRSDSLDWWSQIPTFVNDDQVSNDITRASEVEIELRGRVSRQPERATIR
jgi:hypothetical protein